LTGSIQGVWGLAWTATITREAIEHAVDAVHVDDVELGERGVFEQRQEEARVPDGGHAAHRHPVDQLRVGQPAGPVAEQPVQREHAALTAEFSKRRGQRGHERLQTADAWIILAHDMTDAHQARPLAEPRASAARMTRISTV
jgi:hypothetical protein